MLKQLALILAIVIVALLAIVAALTIVDGGPDAEEEEVDGDPTTATGPRTTIMVSVGSDGSQVQIGCRLPVDDQSPFLVTFENQTGVPDDYQAMVLVRFTEGVTTTVMADAPDLRPGERRSVLPEPWLEPAEMTGCEVVAVQASDRVIILEDG